MFDETQQQEIEISTGRDRIVGHGKHGARVLRSRENTRYEVARRQKILSRQMAQLGCQNLHVVGLGKCQSSQKSHQRVLRFKEIRPTT